MKQIYLLLCLVLFTISANAQQLVHYWHFNTVNGNVDSVAADIYTGSGAPWMIYQAAYPNVSSANLGYMDDVAGDTINTRMGERVGRGIRPRNPSDSMELYIQLPSTGFNDLQISYAVQRSGSGMLKEVLFYTTDGVTYIPHPDTVFVSTTWTLTQFDLSNITAANNNPDFAIKIKFYEQNVASNGNNRIDNFVLEGNSINTSSLIHYWHFNTVSGVIDSVAADIFLGTVAPYIVYQPAFPNVFNGGIMDNVNGDTLNQRLNFVAGNGIRPRNPSDSMELFIQLPTNGFSNIQLSYAVQRSGSGMLKEVLFYTTDGVTFVPHPDTVFVTTSWGLAQFDLSSISAANNNPDFAVKIRFFEQNVASNGNNRIDNFVLEGTSLGGLVSGVSLNINSLQMLLGDTNRLAASVLPSNATNQQVSWSSTNAAVVSVDSMGLVTATGLGTAAIIVTTIEGGFTDTCSIGVLAPAVLTLEIESSGSVIPNATVDIAGDIRTTNANGRVQYSLLPGIYTVNVAATGFFNLSSNINVLSDTTISLQLTGVATVVHYWHFNNLAIGTVTSVDADYTLLPNSVPTISYAGTGTGYMDDYSPGSLLNAQFNEPAGAALRVRNRSEERALVIPLPSTQCEDIKVSFDIHRSGQGMLTNVFEYTLDGSTYLSTGIIPATIPVTETYTTHVIDFSGISGANNNPNFGMRITWIGNTAQDNGNNRYDNIAMIATTTLSSSVAEAKSPKIMAYPNPSVGTLRISNGFESANFRILNIHGQLVQTGGLDEESTLIELSSKLDNGLYFLLIDAAGKTESLRFVLQR